MMSSMSSGRLLMKSRLAGCGLARGASACWLPRRPSQPAPTPVYTCAGVYCVLGVRDCVLLCMPPHSGEVCASVSFMRKKCALNLLACGVLPRVVSTLFTSPHVRWASSLLIFTHCHMGQHTKIENTS